ncbi:MAG: hypothetical protein ACRCV7_04930 [Culicoidibacterales bacterium]
MNKRLWKLLQLNVIYASAKNVANKKGKVSSLNASFYGMLASYPVVLLIAIFVSFVSFSSFKLMPELFFIQAGNMLLMTFGVILFYSFSTFFKSRDFEQYLYYPFTKVEVFYGKLFAVLFVYSSFLFILGGLGFSFGLATGGLIAAICQMLLNVALGLLTFFLTMGLVFYIGTHKVLKKMSSFLLGVGLVIFVITMFIFSAGAGALTTADPDRLHTKMGSNINGIPVINTYYELTKSQPLVLLVFFVITICLCVGVFYLLKKRAMSSYLQNVFSDDKPKKNSKISYKVHSLKKALLSHNMKLVTANKQYGFMLIYMQIMPCLMVLLPLLGLSSIGVEKFQSIEMLAFYTLLGAILVFISNVFTVSENLYSLERENLDYILALPITRRGVFREKQRLALILTTVPLILYCVAIYAILQLTIVNFLVLLVSAVFFNFMYQTYYLLSDEKNPNVIWSSEMDLLQGGMRTFIRMIRIYGLIFLFTILMAASFFLTQYWMIELLIVLILYAVLCYFLIKYQAKRKLI